MIFPTRKNEKFSFLREARGTVSALLHQEESDEVVQAPGENVSWTG